MIQIGAGKSGYNGFFGYRVGRVQSPAHPDLHHRDIQLHPLEYRRCGTCQDLEFSGLGSELLVQRSAFDFISDLIINVGGDRLAVDDSRVSYA